MFYSGGLREAAKQGSNLRSRLSETLLSQDEAIDQRCGTHRWIVLFDERRRAVAFMETITTARWLQFLNLKMIWSDDVVHFQDVAGAIGSQIPPTARPFECS
jgi:hypothetical protein